MAFAHFIPTLWTTAIETEWNAQAVFAGLVNRQYEGTATRGNKVTIAGVVSPAVKDYKAAGRLTTADAISDTGVDLLIDNEKVVDFYVDDIDRVQVAGSLDAYTTASAEALALDADSAIADAAVAGGASLAGAVPTTGDDAYNLINAAHKALTKANVPGMNRVIVVNAEFASILKRADSKLTSVDTSGDSAGLRAGTIGNLGGARIVESNNLPAFDQPQFVAFHSRAIAYVSQLEEVEALRAHDRIADRIRMLHVYGVKVTRPSGVVVFNKNGS